MKEYIVVVGGYGHVGQMICRELGELYPGKVYAAGRSLERAEEFSGATGGKVRPLQINIEEGFDTNFINDVKLVIMCLDQTNTSFVESCLINGIHYVDVSAKYSFLTQVEKLQAVAEANGATAVLSIGLAPGLTNLLALKAKNLMDQVDAIDISIMLGMGDQHGKAAIEWTVDNLGTNFEVVKKNKKVKVASFADGRKTDFGAGLGRKMAYRFNFSDQHVLPRTLGVPSVSTRLSFDSTVVTGLIAWLRATGSLRLLKFKPIRNIVVQMFGKMKFGEDIFVVKVDALGMKNQKTVLAECFLQGRNEARITASIAASVANIVYLSELPHGVYHIEQLFELDNLLHSENQGVIFDTRINEYMLPK
ncbi:saccharopine dehydrogenase family protein [Paenibacillus eucommiae]|uniref:Saccharopine dehydrogenase-like NADP-dependent oxidoreductase n=1 Tax=Paenibacillus eucommiae TaxID=1355755 RepID=A0ABS4IZ63_9BACL|nr:saccharopine dehydrogenase NADP-binding domain-containing protein [Paenibacillus eucommiae]MBP1992835.1 saccharopine dehydrogenase-like NADP-dependent oxidoreductase [Paenibacillus eucommiae]